ncbi:MAG: DUF1660 family phage protein [Candidatus Methanospirareceae archaeon]
MTTLKKLICAIAGHKWREYFIKDTHAPYKVRKHNVCRRCGKREWAII